MARHAFFPGMLATLLLIALSGCEEREDSAGEDSSTRLNYLERPIEDDVFYFVLPDRFANGDPGNDRGDRDGISHGGFDPTHKGYYHGGDLRGLEEKLDYLEGLGITAIWLTPILRNQAVQRDSAGYHGYWIVDFTEIDPHWGGDADLKSLIEAAHARDMKVFFDIITNHTADVIRYRECHNAAGDFLEGDSCPYRSLASTVAGEGYTPFVPERLRDSKRPAWLNDPRWYNNQGDSTWKGESVIYGDFSGLDDIDTRQAEVAERFIAIYRDLIDRFRPDGFRIDTVKHVDLAFWQRFAPAIVEHGRAQGIPQFTVFGEVYEFEPATLSAYTRHGRLPAVLDFALQEPLRAVLADGADAAELEALFAEDDWYTAADRDARQSMTFTGNHDMGRFGYFLRQGKVTAGTGADEQLVRSALAHSLLFLARGVPVIYYGDEQGFTGDGNDQDAREDMFPSQVASYNDNPQLGGSEGPAADNFDPSHPLYRHVAGLAEVYRATLALRRGQQVIRRHQSDGNTLALSRLYGDQPRDTLVLFNFGSEDATVDLPAWARRYSLRYGYSSEPRVDSGRLQVSLPPLSAAVLVGDRETPRTAPAKFTAHARQETRLGQPFLVVRYELEPGEATQQAGPLRITTRFADQTVADLDPPWRAIFPLDRPLDKGSVSLEITLDNLAGDRAAVSREVALEQ